MTQPSLCSALLELPEEAEPSGALAEALEAELRARVLSGGADAAWPPPRLTGLRLRRSGLPDWWNANGNVLLGGADCVAPEIIPTLSGIPSSGAVLLLGAGTRLHKAHTAGRGALIAVGDGANLFAVTLSAAGDSSILIGEGVTATFAAQLDARNGGAILIGAEGLWANDLRMITDDMHAIRDMNTGERLNGFGGRIVVERKVWFGERVQVLGGARIGAETVVGMGSLVTGEPLPANAVCAGRPARVLRRGVTWTREDLP